MAMIYLSIHLILMEQILLFGTVLVISHALNAFPH